MLLAQFIGLLGIISHIICFQQSRRGRVLFIMAIGCFFWAIHFTLLGFYTAAAANIIAALRSFVFYKYKKRDSSLVMYGFIAVFLLATVLTWQGPISLFPLLASIFSTYAGWAVSAQKIRWLTLPAPMFWLMHNVTVHSIGVVSDTLVLISIIVGLYRHRNTREHTDIVRKRSFQKTS